MLIFKVRVLQLDSSLACYSEQFKQDNFIWSKIGKDGVDKIGVSSLLASPSQLLTISTLVKSPGSSMTIVVTPTP